VSAKPMGLLPHQLRFLLQLPWRVLLLLLLKHGLWPSAAFAAGQGRCEVFLCMVMFCVWRCCWSGALCCDCCALAVTPSVEVELLAVHSSAANTTADSTQLVLLE